MAGAGGGGRGGLTTQLESHLARVLSVSAYENK